MTLVPLNLFLLAFVTGLRCTLLLRDSQAIGGVMTSIPDHAMQELDAVRAVHIKDGHLLGLDIVSALGVCALVNIHLDPSSSQGRVEDMQLVLRSLAKRSQKFPHCPCSWSL